MLALYLLLMAGGVLLLIWALTGYYPQHPETALLLMLLNALLLLSVSLFGGASFSTLTNGVLVFGLYGVAFIGGWLEQIGTMLPDPTAGHTLVNIGIITSLIMPSEALWRARSLCSPVTSGSSPGLFPLHLPLRAQPDDDLLRRCLPGVGPLPGGPPLPAARTCSLLSLLPCSAHFSRTGEVRWGSSVRRSSAARNPLAASLYSSSLFFSASPSGLRYPNFALHFCKRENGEAMLK